MTQLDTRETETSQPRPSRLWLAAAAVAAVVLGVALAILSTGSEEAPVATDPTPTTLLHEVTPTSAPAPTITLAEGAFPGVADWPGRGTGEFVAWRSEVPSCLPALQTATQTWLPTNTTVP